MHSHIFQKMKQNAPLLIQQSTLGYTFIKRDLIHVLPSLSFPKIHQSKGSTPLAH